MLTFASPWVLGAGIAAGGAITILHFLSVRRPPELLLPTARFLALGESRAVARSARPSDLWLLACRALALMLACAALAGPQWVSGDEHTVRLIVADGALRSDSMALLTRVNDVARAAANDAAGGGTPATNTGNAAAERTRTIFVWADTMSARGEAVGVRADLSSAIPLAVRAAAALTARAPSIDSLQLYVVASSVRAPSPDSWRAWRAAWPGGVNVLSPARGAVPTVTDTLALSKGTSAATIVRHGRSGRGGTEPFVRFDSVAVDDPVRAAIVMRPPRDSMAKYVVVLSRAASGSTTRAFTSTNTVTSAAGTRSVVTVDWPLDGIPSGWTPMHDTIGAVAARGLTLVGLWSRTSRHSAGLQQNAIPIVWWGDGAVAATERATEQGCVREVGIVASLSSDLLLDRNADGVFGALLAPCAGAAPDFSESTAKLPAFVQDDSVGRTHGAAVAASYFRALAPRQSAVTPIWLSPLLLVLAIALIIVEWVIRDRDVVHA